MASRDGFLVASGVRWASNRVESTGDQFLEHAMKSRPRKPDPAIAKRALQEAADRRAEKDKAELEAPKEKELSGRKGPDPTRYGDWENKGIISDF